MISPGRYEYHKQDIAELEAMPQPLDPVQNMHLERMRAEVAEYEAAQRDEIPPAEKGD